MLTHNWRLGFKYSLPVAMGYLPAGIAFGVLANVAGLPAWASLLLSLLLYAGAAQYACLPMLSSGLPLSSITTNIAAINLRHIFYALPLLSALPDQKVIRSYCLFALTDETYSLLTSIPASQRPALILPISLFNQCWWVMATLAGILIGSALNDWVPHLDFAIVCLFTILAYEQYRLIHSLQPVMVATIALLIAGLLTDHWLLFMAILISLLLTLIPSLIHYFSKAKLPPYE